MTRGAVSKSSINWKARDWSQATPGRRITASECFPERREGARLLPELVEVADSNDRKHFGGLSAEEQAALKTLLQKLTNIHQWHDAPVE